MIIPSDIVLDAKQEALVLKLDQLIDELKPNIIKKIFGSKPFGIYIYGSVGCGKSMLSRAFFESLTCKKLFLHYQDFMSNLHKSLHSYDIKQNVIKKLASEYSAQAKVLCIDEFEIKDITDAMVIARLFSELKKNKVFILLTSNTSPSDLYKNGLKRELFLPFIEMIIKEFDIFHFEQAKDYRMTQASSRKRVLYPINSTIKREMDNIINHLVDTNHYNITTLQVFGRKISFNRTYKSTLVTSFAKLCENNLSYNDYIEICSYFSTIIIENVPIIKANQTDIVIRFINLIDNIYSHNNLLFISLSDSPEKIYQGKARELEFKRTISRLHEIESDDYFKKAKK